MKPGTLRRRYLREAALTLTLAMLAVRFVAPARVFAWANRPPRHIDRFAAEEIDWVAWAVETVATRRAVKAACLPRSLAVQAMLRRRRVASRLCLGVARENGELAAHAWVEVGKNRIIGGAEPGAFTRLAEFGAPADEARAQP